jgi:hypothetical protein
MKTATRQPARSIFWKKEWTVFTALVFGMRALYAVFGIIIERNGASVPLDYPIYARIAPHLHAGWFSHWFVNPWFQWDTIAYMEISILGYTSQGSSIAFMPLYPLLMRFVALFLGGDHLAAALLISTVCSIAALILLYELVLDIFSDAKLAFRTVLAFLVFPTSFFLVAGYTEALFLVLVLGFWLAARRKHWGWSALLASLATLTRLQGLILSPILLWMMFASLLPDPAVTSIPQIKQAFRNLRLLRSLRLSQILFASVPALVAVGYQAWLKIMGLGAISSTLSQHWKIETVAPWTGFYLFLQRLFTMKFIYMDWIDLFLLAIIILLGVMSLRELGLDFSLYIWLTLAILFMRGTPPHLLASYSRYFLALFPIFILLARLRNKAIQGMAAVIALLLQMLLAWVFLMGSWVA